LNKLFLKQFFCKPRILVFFISFNCNLHCAMCFSWIKQKQIKEPTLDEIRTIFNDRMLKNNLEVINITGGEPTLRQDLPEIVKIILQNCSRLKRIDISTNGVNTSQVIDQVERVLAVLLPTNVQLSVSVSLDGVGEVHEKVRETPGIFSNVEKTILGLKELMSLYPFFNLGLNMTVSKLNYKAMDATREFAKNKGLGINFTLAAISDIGVESIRARERFEMNQEEKDQVMLSLKDLLLIGALDSDYARFLFTWLKTGKRNGICAFRQGKAFLLEPDSHIYSCGNFKEFMLGNIMEQPFRTLRNQLSSFRKAYPKRCLTCNSNCYLDV